MVNIVIATEDMQKKMDAIVKKSPVAFRKHMSTYLREGGARIKEQSVVIAKQEARGVTGQYMGGFTISPIKRDPDGGLFVIIYNKKLYSQVVEYGGRWKKLPPSQKLEKWVGAKLNPKNAKERKRLAFAVATAILKRSRSGRRGQLFVGSSTKRGRVLTMSRAMLKSREYLKSRLNFHIEEALVDTALFI